MPEVLQIGPITDAMRQKLETGLTIRQLDDFDPERIDYVLTGGQEGVPPDLMASLVNLKAISVYGVGYNAVDTAEAVRRGILVSHTPNVLNEEVATTAVMLMLACYRELLRDDAYVRSEGWAKQGGAPLTRSADGQTIGILGMGRIGQAIAEKLAPWSPTILYHTRSKKDVPYTYYDNLRDMAEAADVLICITPGGDSTYHIVNADVLKALGPQGTLINVSRGTVVDQEALIAALQDGSLGWAGLDVFEDEPNVPQALREMPNTVLLPHVGSATIETRAAMGGLTVDNLLQHLKDGTMISPVPECAHM